MTQKEGELVMDLSPLAEKAGLKEPVRVVEVTVGGTKLHLPRGADDPTPDSVLKVGGVALNIKTGRLVKG